MHRIRMEKQLILCKTFISSIDLFSTRKNPFECILSGNLEFLEDKVEYDESATYVYEFYDDIDNNLQNKIPGLGNEKYWYPFINNLEEVQRFEMKFQVLLSERKGKYCFLFL